MASWEQKLLDLHIERTLQQTGTLLGIAAEALGREGEDYERLGRIANLLEKVRPLIEQADVSTTSVGVIEKLGSLFAQINSVLEVFKSGTPQSVDYDRIDEITDRILETIPLISTPESVKQDIEKFRVGTKEFFQETLDSLTAEKKSLQDSLKELRKEADDIVNSMKDLQFEGKNLAEIAAGRVLRGDFAERAQKEKKVAFNWTAATWIFAILTIVILLLVFGFHLFGVITNKDTDLQLLGTQALITASLGLIAKWASKRANRHLTEEERYHRLAVNMQTIDAFIAKIDAPYGNLVRSQIAIAMFSDPTIVDTPTDFESSPLMDSIKNLFNRSAP